MNQKTIDKYLLISGKKIFTIVVLWFAAVILHNAIYAISGVEEAVFFTIAFPVLPLYLIVSIIYSLYYFYKKKLKKKSGKKSSKVNG